MSEEKNDARNFSESDVDNIKNINDLDNFVKKFPECKVSVLDKLLTDIDFFGCIVGNVEQKIDLFLITLFSCPEHRPIFYFNFNLMKFIDVKDVEEVLSMKMRIEMRLADGAFNCKSLQLVSAFIESAMESAQNQRETKLEESMFSAFVSLYDFVLEKIAKATVCFRPLGNFGMFPELQKREMTGNFSNSLRLSSRKSLMSDELQAQAETVTSNIINNNSGRQFQH